MLKTTLKLSKFGSTFYINGELVETQSFEELPNEIDSVTDLYLICLNIELFTVSQFIRTVITNSPVHYEIEVLGNYDILNHWKSLILKSISRFNDANY